MDKDDGTNISSNSNKDLGNSAITSTELTALKDDLTTNVDSIAAYIDWIFKDPESQSSGLDLLYKAATDPQYYPALREITSTIMTKGWVLGDDLGVPMGDKKGTLQPAERLQLALQAIRTRDTMERELVDTYGSSAFEIQLRSMTALELTLSNEISSGFARFKLYDATKYAEGKFNLLLGIIDVTPQQDDLIVTLVQDYSDVESSNENDTHDRNLDGVIDTRQRSIRKIMRNNRPIMRDAYEDETSGVEELMIFTVGTVLNNTAINPKYDSVIIPNPELNAWTETAGKISLYKTIAQTIRSQPTEIKEQLRNLVGAYLYNTSDEDGDEYLGSTIVEAAAFSKGKENHIMLSTGEIGIGTYLRDLLIAQIPAEFKPSDQDINSYDFSTFDSWIASMTSLALRTPISLRTLHVYRNAFKDVPAEQIENGRRIKFDAIENLPFTQEAIITPKK